MTKTNYGEVFTRRWVVETILDLAGYTVDRDLGLMRILEPSCGSGAFLSVIVERLLQSAEAHGRPLQSLRSAVRAYDVQPGQVAVSLQLVFDALVDAGADEVTAASLAREWITCEDFLLMPECGELFDVVASNPPYVRFDNLDPVTAAAYRARWQTMKGRGDLFIGFYERSLRMLKPGGRLGFICADRWMRNTYGRELRDLVSRQFSVEHVWTMHDVDAFESEVSAYPAITILARKNQGQAWIVDANASFGAQDAQSLTDIVRSQTINKWNSTTARVHTVDSWFAGSEHWPTGSPARLAMVSDLNERFPSLEDSAPGTRVRIGIATGADKIFITKTPDLVEHDRLLPLILRADLVSGHPEWGGHYLINPWDDSGNLVDLQDYPKLNAYLNESPQLRKRFVARKNPAQWYRTIDKVNPALVGRPKLLIQDMKTSIHPVLEKWAYPHHNLYAITSEGWDLEILGALLLTRFAQAFVESYGVRMRGGTLRFQAQYLRKIRVPRPDSITAAQANELRRAFQNRDVEAATNIAAVLYGVNIAEVELEGY